MRVDWQNLMDPDPHTGQLDQELTQDRYISSDYITSWRQCFGGRGRRS